MPEGVLSAAGSVPYFCSDAFTIILLPFMAILSIIVISFLNEQYGCSSICSSDFIDGQPCNTYYDSMPKCLLSRVIILISSTVMHSGISIHDFITFMVMHIPSIFSPLFVLTVVSGESTYYE